MNRIIAVIVVSILAGCSGPTKSGKIARTNAHQRMDAVNADLAAQQAMQQFEVGQLKTAINTIDAAIERFDKNASYHLLRGRILIEQHKLDAASVALSRSIELNPEVAEPYYFLGVLHQRWSEDEEALACYKKAMSCDRTHPQFLLATAETHVALGQLNEAITLLENVGKEFQHQPSITSLLGHIHLRNGNPKEAANFLSDSRLLGNDDSEVLVLLASAQFNSGNYADCLQTIAQIQENGTLSSGFQRIKGKCLAATGRKIQGRDLCLKVTRQKPDDVGAWIDLGFIAWDMGDYKRLATCGKKISELAPSNMEGPLFEGIVAMRHGDTIRGEQLLAKIQSDNTIDGIDYLLRAYEKTAKIAVETAIVPNMTPKTVEGVGEEHSNGLDKGRQPIVGVTQESSLAP